MVTFQFNNQMTHEQFQNFVKQKLMQLFFTKEIISIWIERLKDNKVYAILSGFQPEELPGVGRFYDFLARLVFADQEQKRKQRNRRNGDCWATSKI